METVELAIGRGLKIDKTLVSYLRGNGIKQKRKRGRTLNDPTLLWLFLPIKCRACVLSDPYIYFYSFAIHDCPLSINTVDSVLDS